MSIIKKSASLLVSFAIIVSVIWITPVISDASVPNSARMTFEEYIVASIENSVERIDISHYIQNNSEWLALGNSDGGQSLSTWLGHELIPDIIDNNPQLFNVDARSNQTYWYTDFSLFEFMPVYNMNHAEYTAALRRFNAAAMQAMNHIRHASNDFEKALMLHNYIVLHTEYDSELLDYYKTHGFMSRPLRPISHTAYGSLVDGLAVCDGYAKAYMHLLNMVGIESRIISGHAGGDSHAWSIVKLGGNWYHVDPTWNDPINNGFCGSVSYNYFLIDGREINKTHSGWSLPAGIITDSTSYNNAFFREVETDIVKLGNFYYWIESNSSIDAGFDNNFIKRYNISTRRIDTVHSYESIWYAEGTENLDFYRAWFMTSKIAAYNGLIYFNTAREIRSFDPETSFVETIHIPANLGGTGNRFIFGFTMRDNVIRYSIRTTPNARETLSSVSVPLAPSVDGGEFTSADALIILRSGAGLINLSIEQMLRYDLNGDGVVNTADAIIVLRIAAGLTTINN
jgi:hypothetical protein